MKNILRDTHFDDVDWARQRVMINERIDAKRSRRPTAFRWAAVATATAAIALFAWFGIHRAIQVVPQTDQLAELEQTIDEIIDGRIPTALVALNGWTDVDTTSWQTMPAAYDPFDGADTDGGQKEAL
jgi:hypothetical protein